MKICKVIFLLLIFTSVLFTACSKVKCETRKGKKAKKYYNSLQYEGAVRKKR